MKKKTIVISVIFVLLIAAVATVATLAFFPNESDTAYLRIGSNDQFSISIGVGETQGQLVPVEAVNDNTAQGEISDSDGVRIKVPYVIGEAEEGVTAMRVLVYASSAVWKDKDGQLLSSELQDYMQGKLDFFFYKEDESPQFGWSNVSAGYTFESPEAGSTGNLILAIRFNVTDELLPEEIMGATVTVSVTSEFMRA